MTHTELIHAIRNRLKTANRNRPKGSMYHLQVIQEGARFCRYNLAFRRIDGKDIHCCVLGDTTGNPEAILKNLSDYLSE